MLLIVLVNLQNQVILLFDQRSYLFTNLITFKEFQKELNYLYEVGTARTYNKERNKG